MVVEEVVMRRFRGGSDGSGRWCRRVRRLRRSVFHAGELHSEGLRRGRGDATLRAHGLAI